MEFKKLIQPIVKQGVVVFNGNDVMVHLLDSGFELQTVEEKLKLTVATDFVNNELIVGTVVIANVRRVRIRTNRDTSDRTYHLLGEFSCFGREFDFDMLIGSEKKDQDRLIFYGAENERVFAVKFELSGIYGLE